MEANTPPGADTQLAHNSIGFWRSLAQPVAIQAPVLGAALLTATMASITGGAGPLSFVPPSAMPHSAWRTPATGQRHFARHPARSSRSARRPLLAGKPCTGWTSPPRTCSTP